MKPKSRSFAAAAREAMADEQFYASTGRMVSYIQKNRATAIGRLPEYDALVEESAAIKSEVLRNLDFYLEEFEAKVVENGGQVHWCPTAEDACEAVLSICRNAGASVVTKGKSMVTEEIALNSYLVKHGITPIETDIGEYILQLADEPPVHLVAPALHKTKQQVAELLYEHHQIGGLTNDDPAEKFVTEFRKVLRPKYSEAGVGITGANFLVAETGSTVIVTNEGNGDLTQTLPKVHIVVATIEKVVPTLEDAATLLRVLGRSATGQEMTVYTTFSTGKRRSGDVDGPEELHVVLLDGGRSSILGTETQDVLRCIRCGSCLNHCPIYRSAGGHAYGWVYPGPIGAALNPHLIGLEEGFHLPRATSICGRCDEVCPVQIPLTSIHRRWREKSFERGMPARTERFGLGLWAYFARRPRLYRFAAKIAIAILGLFGRKRGRFRSLPLAKGWTEGRDMPAPEGRTFIDEWRSGRGRNGP